MATALPSFPFYPQRFLSATNHWRPEAVGAYLRLLLHQWDNIFVPDDGFAISRITGLDEKGLGLCWDSIRDKFVEFEPGKLQNEFLESLRDSKIKFIEKQAANGKKGGRPPKEKPKAEPKENPTLTQIYTQTVSQINPLGKGKQEIGNKKIIKGGEGGKPPKPPTAPPKVVISANPKAVEAWAQLAHGFGDDTRQLWESLCLTVKWKKKETVSLVLSLKKLLKYEEPFAAKLIENAIAGGYQGVIFDNTDANYETYLRTKNKNAASNVGTNAANGVISEEKKFNDRA